MIKVDFNTIKNEYNEINMRHTYEYNQRLNELYSKHPKLKELKEKLIDIKINKAKSKISNTITEKELADYDNQVKDLEKELNDYMSTNNIKESDMEMKYDCDKCKDEGFIDGKKCDCFKKKELDYLIKLSNFDDQSSESFEKLDINKYNQKIKVADNYSYSEYMKNELSEIGEMILNIDKKPFNIIFTGPSGTGKTFLSRCIGNQLLKKNKSIFYITVSDLITNYINNSNDLSYLINNCDLLILDNFGKENITSFSISLVFEVIDKRLNRKLSTIVATNFSFKELSEYYDDNICSRLINEYHTTKLYGEDLRRV